MKLASLKVAFIGWGAVNSCVAGLLRERSTNVEFVAVATRDASKHLHAIPRGAHAITKPEALASLAPDVVVEAASKSAVEMWVPSALKVAKTVIVSSTSAFVDGELLMRLRDVADQCNSRLIVPTGAIGGIDALSSAAVLDLEEVVHRISKPPSAWRNTNAEKNVDLSSLSEPTIFFSGSARAAATEFPQNANSTVVTALAGIGLERTIVELVADPLLQRNQHTISARGSFGQFVITLENEPLRTNPKSSELTALNLTKLIEEQSARIVVGG